VQPTAEGLGRREFIKRTGLALAGTSVASAFVGPRRVWAAGPVELTFASAKFYGKQTIGEVVDAFNNSQSKVRVTYKELPPPSSSTEVHQTPVQQLARRNGDPDVFTQDSRKNNHSCNS
jgi:multiple sugar transport system substrate-binding protein